MNPATGALAGPDIETQANQVLDNLEAVLPPPAPAFNDAVKVTVYLADLKDFAAVNQIYAARFGEDPGAHQHPGRRLPAGACWRST
jgi:2-iminobutanoate/2-iminopropanoate deaminase